MSYLRLTVLVGIQLCLGVGGVCGGVLVLAEGGESRYRIVVAEDASASTRHAGEELSRFLGQIAGVEMPVISDARPAGEHEIWVGSSRRLGLLGDRAAIDMEALGEEGYVIRTVGSRLLIAGGEPRGTLYGVYGLLEDHLGCRWFAPGVSRIPSRPTLEVGPLDERRVPVLEYREPFTYDCFDGDWCARNRVNSSRGELTARHGGKIAFGRGFFVHSFERLVPPDVHFDEHPEYFSLVGGERRKERSQLCCTNEEVIRLCTEGVLEAMEQQPEAFVFSVSQNDWYNYCECAPCQALAEREGTQMAPVLHLVNRVAEAVEGRFPDKAVETLAYQWTRKAPRTMRPRPNVIVRLCSIECCFSQSLAASDHPANVAFRRDAEEWARVCDRLWVWDYVTAFRHYLLPFPNLRIRDDNIRFFVEHNVKGIFEQDTYDTPHSELAQLGGYLTAKLLWNPDVDADAVIDEFLEGYYGEAANAIRRYIDLLHDYAEEHHVQIDIWVGPDGPHLSDELLGEADRLWQQAEDAARDDPDVLRRVRLSRMSVDYALVERARLQSAGSAASNQAPLDLARRRFEPFMETLGSSGMTRLMEYQPLDLPAYRAGLVSALGMGDE